jgi:hypothetical protein
MTPPNLVLTKAQKLKQTPFAMHGTIIWKVQRL